MSLITSLMRMLMLLSIIFCSNLFTSLLITSKCLRLVIRVKGSCPISPLWPPTLQMGFTHMETADQRTPEHKRLLIKTTCGSPVMLWCLGMNAIAKAPVNLALLHWHTWSTWPDPNPAGRFYNRITETSCYCCSLHCPKTHNWIEEFMVFPLFFFFGLTVSPPAPPLSSKRQSAQQELPHPSFSHSMPLWLQAVMWGTAGLYVLFLNWQGSPFPIPTFSSFSEASVHVANLANLWRSVQREHQQSQIFQMKWKEAKWQHTPLRPPLQHLILANHTQNLYSV